MVKLLKKFLNMIYLSKANFYVSRMTEGIRTLADLGIELRGNSKFGSDSKKILTFGET